MERPGDLRKDSLSSIFLLLLGGGYLWYDLHYPLDTLANPGPGVFPLAVGLVLVMLAALQLAQSGGRLLRRTPGAKPGNPLSSPAEAPDRARPGRPPWPLVGILVLYLLVVSWIGFLTSTFILVIICSKLLGTPGWSRPAALAAGLLLACYLLFVVWLKVPLPAGFLL